MPWGLFVVLITSASFTVFYASRSTCYRVPWQSSEFKNKTHKWTLLCFRHNSSIMQRRSKEKQGRLYLKRFSQHLCCQWFENQSVWIESTIRDVLTRHVAHICSDFRERLHNRFPKVFKSRRVQQQSCWWELTSIHFLKLIRIWSVALRWRGNRTYMQ